MFQVVVQVGEQVTCRLLLTEGGRSMTSKPSIVPQQTLYTVTAHKSPQEVLAFELSTKISELGLQDIKALVDRGWPPHDEQTLYTATAHKSLPSPL